MTYPESEKLTVRVRGIANITNDEVNGCKPIATSMTVDCDVLPSKWSHVQIHAHVALQIATQLGWLYGSDYPNDGDLIPFKMFRLGTYGKGTDVMVWGITKGAITAREIMSNTSLVEMND